jgi:hypothetical protein
VIHPEYQMCFLNHQLASDPLCQMFHNVSCCIWEKWNFLQDNGNETLELKMV